jgi:hypothetical protein
MNCMSKISKRIATGSADGISPRCWAQGGSPPEILLSRRELADRWHCCIHTIARRHDLQAVRLSRRLLRYRLKDIEAIEAAAVSK